MNRIRTQIAGISSLDDALAAVEAGVDSIGFTLRLPAGPHDGLTEQKAREIVRALPPFVTPLLITYLDRGDDAVELCRYLGVKVIQLHGEIDRREVRRIRAGVPGIKILKSIIVGKADPVQEPESWASDADGLLTDTFDPETGRTGATGKAHDWAISRRIVDSVRVPVILAGGLTPDNVAEAIRQVRPWGVDVHTGVENADGTFSRERARDFVRAAEAATR